MIRYKCDIIELLKEKGYSTYRLRQEKILGQSTIKRLKDKNINIELSTIDIVCKLTGKKIQNLIEFVPDEN